MTTQEKGKSINNWMIKAQMAAGLIAGFLVCPLNVVVDKSVIRYSNGEGTLKSMTQQQIRILAKTPFQFLKSCYLRYMYLVYAFTYTSSNVMDHLNFSDNIPHPIQKLGAVFLVNTTCSLIKDKKYAEELKKVKDSKLPISSLSLFFVRDFIAMASAFTLPPILGKYISNKYGITLQNGERIAQVVCPLMVQFIATPIHLYALSIYKNPDWGFKQRATNIQALFFNALFMRMARFLHTYGLGGIANIELRSIFKRRVVLQ